MRLELGARFAPRLYLCKGFSQWKKAVSCLRNEAELSRMAYTCGQQVGQAQQEAGHLRDELEMAQDAVASLRFQLACEHMKHSFAPMLVRLKMRAGFQQWKEVSNEAMMQGELHEVKATYIEGETKEEKHDRVKETKALLLAQKKENDWKHAQRSTWAEVSVYLIDCLRF